MISKEYDPALSARLVAQAKELVADTHGEFPFPDMRAVDLAIRLVAPGPKACAVSASECHEITEAVIAAYDRDTFPIRARSALIALADQLEAVGKSPAGNPPKADPHEETRSSRAGVYYHYECSNPRCSDAVVMDVRTSGHRPSPNCTSCGAPLEFSASTPCAADGRADAPWMLAPRLRKIL